MKIWPLACMVLCTALSGCVVGYGHCLFLGPVQASLTGRIHFRSYPAGGGIDRVAVLTFDRTAYVYAPAESRQCLAANEAQLTGWSEYPPELKDDMRVTVDGTLIPAVSPRQHTRFLIKVRNIQPELAAPPARPPARDPPVPEPR